MMTMKTMYYFFIRKDEKKRDLIKSFPILLPSKIFSHKEDHYLHRLSFPTLFFFFKSLSNKKRKKDKYPHSSS